MSRVLRISVTKGQLDHLLRIDSHRCEFGYRLHQRYPLLIWGQWCTARYRSLSVLLYCTMSCTSGSLLGNAHWHEWIRNMAENARAFRSHIRNICNLFPIISKKKDKQVGLGMGVAYKGTTMPCLGTGVPLSGTAMPCLGHRLGLRWIGTAVPLSSTVVPYPKRLGLNF